MRTPQEKNNEGQLVKDCGGEDVHLKRESFWKSILQEGQPQNASGQYAQVSHDAPHHVFTPRISLSRSRWKQLSWYSTPAPQLSPLYPSPSPLANGVFVPPACGKDDKTIGENDYGWGGDYFHKSIIFSHSHPIYPYLCYTKTCAHLNISINKCILVFLGTILYLFRSLPRRQIWSHNLK